MDILVADRIFNLPRTMANSIDPGTGRPCIHVGINGKYWDILVEEALPIPYNVFCVLKDIGILNHYEKYAEGEVFKPL